MGQPPPHCSRRRAHSRLSGVSAGMFSARKSPQRRTNGPSSWAQGLEQDPGIAVSSVHTDPAQQTAEMASADCASSAAHAPVLVLCAVVRSAKHAKHAKHAKARHTLVALKWSTRIASVFWSCLPAWQSAPSPTAGTGSSRAARQGGGGGAGYGARGKTANRGAAGLHTACSVQTLATWVPSAAYQAMPPKRG